MRRRRKRIAGLVMLGWLFAQIVTIVHACPALNPTQATDFAAAAAATPMPADCATMARQAGSNANICQSHCVAGEQVDTQAQVPTPALAPQPALTVHVADPQSVIRADHRSSSRPDTGPPPTLLFSRLLI